ncbi:unnamed protein product, partial [Orchesella dallaii]
MAYWAKIIGFASILLNFYIGTKTPCQNASHFETSEAHGAILKAVSKTNVKLDIIQQELANGSKIRSRKDDYEMAEMKDEIENLKKKNSMLLNESSELRKEVGIWKSKYSTLFNDSSSLKKRLNSYLKTFNDSVNNQTTMFERLNSEPEDPNYDSTSAE